MDKISSAVFCKRFLCLLAVALLVNALAPTQVTASDLPLAAGSPLMGFAFDDRPLLLPVQRNFQMAMLTASSELGRSCGRMEAYGWRMSASEQQRVNQIFNNTVERLRGLGYSIEALAPPSLSRDITLFSADRPDKHFLLMWSAGEIGLVMTLCQTTAPIAATYKPRAAAWPTIQTFPQDIVKSTIAPPARVPAHVASGKFTPVGNWVGSYTCPQGYTGATLHIAGMHNNNFTGDFHFYPTSKNRYVAAGRFMIYGQYDPGSQRILINPGKWIQHPKGVYTTVMVGGFDPIARTFSAYFQGVTGCTSFEAKYSSGAPEEKAQHKKKTGKHVKKAAVRKVAPEATAPAPAATSTPGEAPASIVLPPANAPTPAPEQPKPAEAAPAPAAPAPEPTPSPAPTPPAAPEAPAPAPVGTTAPAAPQKSGSLERAISRMIMASAEYINPQAPQVQPPVMVQPPVQAAPAPIMNPIAPPASYPQQVQSPEIVPTESVTNALPQQVQPPVQAYPPIISDRKAPDAQYPTITDMRAPPASPPQGVDP